jgi:hypothetical protein
MTLRSCSRAPVIQPVGWFEEDVAAYAHIEAEANSNLEGLVRAQILARDF